jgi:uncharacterized protein
MSANEIQVCYAPDRRRFEARVAGRAEVAVLDVVPTRDAWTLSHTRVPPAIERRGVGTALVRAALAHARAEGVTVVPKCWFVVAHLRRHPEEADVVDERYRDVVTEARR